MKKTKAKYEFNPTDYDYMDDMPFEGWMWEFVRRNDKYRSKYSELLRIITKYKKGLISSTSLSLNVNDISSAEYLDNLLLSIDECRISVSVVARSIINSKHFLLIPAGTPNLSIYIPNPDTEYRDFDATTKPRIDGISPVLYYMPDDELIKSHEKHEKQEKYYSVLSNKNKLSKSEQQFIKEYSKYGDINYSRRWANIIENELTPKKLIGPRKTIFLGISTDSKLADIRKKIEAIFKRYIKPSQPRVRTDKWKYYLITYDIKQKYPDINYEDIAGLLIKAFPDITVTKNIKLDSGNKKKKRVPIESSVFFSNKNCANYYKSALSLINGEYKKFLYQ